MIIEELCGRISGKRTFSLTRTSTFDLDIAVVTKNAKERNFRVENQSSLGLSLRTDAQSVSFMKRGSAVIVGTKDQKEAISLYNSLIGRTEAVAKSL